MVEDECCPRDCWRDTTENGLTLAEGFLLLWHSMRGSLDLPNPGLEYLLFCASLLELLLQDYLLVLWQFNSSQLQLRVLICRWMISMTLVGRSASSRSWCVAAIALSRVMCAARSEG